MLEAARERCLAPGRTFKAYLWRLTDAFSRKYVSAVVLTYGVNQGMGERFLFSAQSFYVLDSLGLDATTAGLISGFANVPWQLKSLFGLLSDTVPINGLHRSPYMLLAGVLGVAANLLLTILNPEAVGYAFAALLLLLANVNFAVPDVMIDATVAERAKTHPARAADLQALCWGSLGALQIPAAISKGYLLEGFGVHVLFGLAVLTATCVTIPPMLGWLGEKRRPGPRGLRATLQDSRVLCGQVWGHPTKKFIVRSAAIVGAYSVTLACIQLSFGRSNPNLVAIFTLLGNALLCAALYATLRQLDVTLARAVVYTFLKGALCPRTAIIFEWNHAPAGSDNRCWSRARCDAASTFLNGTADELPCGWATERDWPCLPPWLLGWVDVASAAALVFGTALYTSKFQTWTYRSILCLTQACWLLITAPPAPFAAPTSHVSPVPSRPALFGEPEPRPQPTPTNPDLLAVSARAGQPHRSCVGDAPELADGHPRLADGVRRGDVRRRGRPDGLAALLHLCGEAVPAERRGLHVCALHGPLQLWKHLGTLPRRWPLAVAWRRPKAGLRSPLGVCAHSLAVPFPSTRTHPVPGTERDASRFRERDGGGDGDHAHAGCGIEGAEGVPTNGAAGDALVGDRLLR